MRAKLLRYLAELGYAWQVCADTASRIRMMLATVRFHWRNWLARPITPAEAARRIHIRVRLNGRVYPLVLRPLCGDVTIFYEILMDEYYAFDRAKLGRARVIVDLGGNVGMAALYLAIVCEPEWLVCVEADRANFELLEHNLAAVGCQRRLIHAAVAPEGVRHVRIASHGPAWSRSVGATDRPTCTVPALSMDQVLAHCPGGRADLLKVNIEGSERQVIGPGATWLDRVDAVLIELHDAYPFEDFDSDMTGRCWSVFRSGSLLGNNATLALPGAIRAA
jgi:FkbM family methyltransferase